MMSLDANGDGNLDLLAVGNSFGTEISLGRYDASYGHVLIGDGKGNFKNERPDASGFVVNGDAKGLARLVNANGKTIVLVSKNNGPLEAFEAKDQAGNLLQLEPMDASAIITFPNGRKSKVELHYGSTYLSHSDRVLMIPQSALSVVIRSFAGEERVVPPENLRPVITKHE